MKSSRLSAAVGSLFILTFMLLVGLPVAVRSQAAAKSSIQGVWRITERTSTGPNAATTKNPQPSLYIFSGKYYSIAVVGGDKPRPGLPDPAKATASDLRAVWGAFVAQSGTYDLSGGNLLTLRPLVSLQPEAMKSGAFATRSYKLEGNTLTMVFKATQDGPVANPTTIKFTRLE